MAARRPEQSEFGASFSNTNSEDVSGSVLPRSGRGRYCTRLTWRFRLLNLFPKVVSVAVGGAYRADFESVLCIGTYIVVVKGGVAVLGRVSPSEVIWKGAKVSQAGS